MFPGRLQFTVRRDQPPIDLITILDPLLVALLTFVRFAVLVTRLPTGCLLALLVLVFMLLLLAFFVPVGVLTGRVGGVLFFFDRHMMVVVRLGGRTVLVVGIGPAAAGMEKRLAVR